MQGRASLILVRVAIVGVIACVIGTSSPAQATAGTDDDEDDTVDTSLETSASGGGSTQREAPPVCSPEKHRCGAGPNFVCCEHETLCCRHKGGILYCAKKKCSKHQP